MANLLDFFGNLALQSARVRGQYGRGEIAAEQEKEQQAQQELERQRQAQRDALQQTMANSLIQDRVADNRRADTTATTTEAYRDRQLRQGEQRIEIAERNAGHSGEAASRAADAASRAATTFVSAEARRNAEGIAAEMADEWQRYPRAQRHHNPEAVIRHRLRSEVGSQLGEGEIEGIASAAMHKVRSGARR